MTPEARFRQLLTQHQRIAIAGVPGAGKTTLSGLAKGRPVLHTDDYIGEADWESVPGVVAHKTPSGPVAIEGVRALAAAQIINTLAKANRAEPITLVIWLDQPHPSVRYTPEQERAAKGRRTSFAKWLRENAGRIEVVRL